MLKIAITQLGIGTQRIKLRHWVANIMITASTKFFRPGLSTLTLLISLSLLAPLSQSHAQSLAPQQESEVQHIFDTVFSPFCPGRLLRDCPSYKAHELKDQIRADLASGKNIEQITSDLYNTYGSTIRALPEAHGFGLVAWLAPFLFLAAGGVIIISWLRSKHKVEEKKVNNKEISPEMRARIESELSSR